MHPSNPVVQFKTERHSGHNGVQSKVTTASSDSFQKKNGLNIENLPPNSQEESVQIIKETHKYAQKFSDVEVIGERRAHVEQDQDLERKRITGQKASRQEQTVSIYDNSKQIKSAAMQMGNNLSSTHKTCFGKFNDGSTSQNRLEELLQKTESYTRFILQQNQLHRKQKEKMKGDEANLKNGKGIDNLKSQSNIISKRRQNKFLKTNADEQNNDSDDENPQMLTKLLDQPLGLNPERRLRDYQLDGLNWMISLNETGINGILADEMGLGKTIQTISLLCFLRDFKKINGHHLLIMPKSVVGNWQIEFKKWCPQIKVCNLIARKECREEIIKNELMPGNFDVCITTFEGVRICLTYLKKFNWQYIIIDEAHKIKNEDSQTSQRIREIKSKFRLLLTGTPLQNNLHELWSLLNFLLPNIFTSSSDFDEWFDLKNDGTLTDKEMEVKNSEIIKQLHRILRPFMMRRIKREVEKALLPKIEMHINVGITELQKSIYRQLLKKSTIEKTSSTSFYKNILVQLRKVCNHPYLFMGIEPEDAPELGDHLVKASGKMQFLEKLLTKCKKENSQTLIFSGFTTMLDILEDFCRFKEYNYCRLDGNTDLDVRQSQIDDFTSPDTDKFIFLISTRAGGLGLNLMTANTVVLFDSDWNPQMDLQAMDRAHRIGQKKQVRVYRLVTKNTMEDKMIEKQTLKLKLDSMIIQKGRQSNNKTSFQRDDLKDMVNYGADAIFEMGSNIDERDIEQMIIEGEEKAKNINAQFDDTIKEKFNMANFEMNSCNLYEFEDVDYLKEKRKEAESLIQKNVIAMLDAETAENSRRKVKKNLAESNLCPKIYGNGNVGVSNEAKKKRLSKVTDFRFFPDPERLKELIEWEMEAKYAGYIQGKEDVMFTPEMKIEKELIESKGFPEWERRDFQKFVQALELFATDDYSNISKHMEDSKTSDEVKIYAKVFFERINTLNDSSKIIHKIEKAQKNVNFNMRAPSVISQKLSQYEYPLDQMNLTHATQKSKFFSKESDALLLYLTDKLGYGKWGDIKRAIKRESRCRFDHLFMSRGEDDLKKRVIYLVQSIEKEFEEQQKQENKQLGMAIPQKVDTEKPSFLDMQKEVDFLVQETEEQAMKYLQNLNNFSNNTMNMSHNNIKKALEIGKEESKEMEMEQEYQENKEVEIVNKPHQEFKQHIAKIMPSTSEREQEIEVKEAEIEQKLKIISQQVQQNEEQNFENDSSCVLDEQSQINNIDKDMMDEELSNDYDDKKKKQKKEEPSKKQTKNQKKKQQKKKKQNEDSLSNISEESGIRLGNESVGEDRENRRERYLKNRNQFDSQSKIDNESDELNELMNQEMMREVNNNNQDSAVKLDSNGCNNTTDMETNNERPSFISNQGLDNKKQSNPQNRTPLKNGYENGRRTQKSNAALQNSNSKQMNLAAWVNGGSCKKQQIADEARQQQEQRVEAPQPNRKVNRREQNMAGQKRNKCDNRLD